MKIIISFIGKHKYITLLLLLIAISATCQLYQIGRDLNGLHEYATAEYAILARNMAEYGPISTKFGPACNINPLTGDFLYYLYHPFLTVYFYALLFKIFGSTILIGRLISMFFFSLGAICLYFLVSKFWSKNIALWAIFFYLFFPVSQYFGKFVYNETVIIPFILLFLLFYYLWVDKNKPLYFYLMLASYFLACNMEWFAYYLAPITVIHYRYILKNKNKQIFMLICVGTLSFIAFFAFNYFLTGSFLGIQSQWPANMQTPIEGFIKHGITVRMHFRLFFQSFFYLIFIEHLFRSFTFPAMLVILYFFFNYHRFKYLTAPTIYILFIPALFLCHGLFFPRIIFDHIYITAYLSAAFAVVCALVISRLSKPWQVLFAIIFLLFSALNINTLYTINNTNQTRLMLGKSISSISTPEEGIALSEPFFSPFIEYFGHRKILYGVTSWEKLRYIINSGKIKYFITNFGSFKDYLIKKYPAIHLPNNFIAFDLKI